MNHQRFEIRRELVHIFGKTLNDVLGEDEITAVLEDIAEIESYIMGDTE